MPLLIHGEVTTPGVDVFDKEATFIEEVIKARASNCREHDAMFILYGFEHPRPRTGVQAARTVYLSIYQQQPAHETRQRLGISLKSGQHSRSWTFRRHFSSLTSLVSRVGNIPIN